FRAHQELKQQLDPCGVCNPGRMYAGLWGAGYANPIN
ncbi:hypothetical protein OFN61_25060, partial [Escherichia coli]|nr:hypothetical protein [Escherichia coli]